MTSVARTQPPSRSAEAIRSRSRPARPCCDETAWVTRLDSQNAPVEEAVNLFVANRRWMTRILRSLPEHEFARAGMHSQAGRQTLAELVVIMANHVDHHLRFLYAKRANVGAAVPPRYTTN